ncbi:MAG: ABC transporter substrate-binding protein [Clostridia bacterium]|nr:ABC transporter substrate-binding protein [Clostridia bacterium]
MRSTKHIIRIFLALCLFLTSILTACRNSSDIWNDASSLPTPTPVKVLSDQITMILHDDQSSYDPTLKVGEEMQGLLSLSIESLFSLDDQQRPTPSLCVDYQTTEESMEWTFRIRQDIRFHDGTPLTAKQIVSCLEELQESDAWNWIFRYIASYEAEEEYVLKIRAHEGYNGYPLLYAMTFPVYLRGDHIYGTGPYRLVEYVKGSRMILERNDNWWRLLPTIRRITALVISDFNRAQNYLSEGHAQLAYQSEIVFTGPKTNALHSRAYLTSEMEYLSINTRSSVLSSLAMRKAIAYILNRDDLISTVYQGQAVGIQAPVAPDSFAGTGLQFSYDRNSASAQYLFNLSGWVDADRDGLLEKPIPGWTPPPAQPATPSPAPTPDPTPSPVPTEVPPDQTPGPTPTPSPTPRTGDPQRGDEDYYPFIYDGTNIPERLWGILAPDALTDNKKKAPDGYERLHLTLVTSADNVLRRACALRISEQWNRIGIEVEVVPLEKQKLELRLQEGDYDLALLGWDLSVDNNLRPLLHSEGNSNHAVYHSNTMDSLLDKARTAQTESSYAKAMNDIYTQCLKDLPILPLFFLTHKMEYSDRLDNIPAVRQNNLFRNINQWTVTLQ